MAPHAEASTPFTSDALTMGPDRATLAAASASCTLYLAFASMVAWKYSCWVLYAGSSCAQVPCLDHSCDQKPFGKEGAGEQEGGGEAAAERASQAHPFQSAMRPVLPLRWTGRRASAGGTQNPSGGRAGRYVGSPPPPKPVQPPPLTALEPV